MPLFRQLGQAEIQLPVKERKGERMSKDPGATLARLCLMSIADNINKLWVQDYAQNYMDQYFFRYIMGPFNELPSELLMELLSELSSCRLLTRAALHVLLLPQLRHLSLPSCPGLITANLCAIIGARCQSLLSLDLSGAVKVPSQEVCDLLGHLPRLRSLCLAETMCDGGVMRALPSQCPSLCHLDVTRCNLFSEDLLQLSPWHPASPGLPHLRSLLAWEMNSGMDASYPAAILLLSLSRLERVALDGLGEACDMLSHGKMWDFYSDYGMPDLREMWVERVLRGGVNGVTTASTVGRVEEESLCRLSEAMNDCSRIQDSYDKAATEDENEEDDGQVEHREGPGCDCNDAVTLESASDKEAQMTDSRLTLPLREAHGVTFATVGPAVQLCPHLCALTVAYDPFEYDDFSRYSRIFYGSRTARALAQLSSSLQSLTLRFPGPLLEMVQAVEPVVASLVSLTLEEVRADGVEPLLCLLRSCSDQLTTLKVHLDSIRLYERDGEEEEEEEEEAMERQQDRQALPGLPRLSCLDLSFCDYLSFPPCPHQKTMLWMSWRSLKGVLWALLRGSPVLETVTLAGVPCPLDSLFLSLLEHDHLQHLKHLDITSSDVSMATLLRLVATVKGLSTLNISGCWAVTRDDVTRLERAGRGRRQKLCITWE